MLCLEHTGRLHDGTDGLEDPLRPLRLAKARAPVGEHGEVEARVVDREPTGDFPVDAGPQLSDRVAVRRPSKAWSTITEQTSTAGTEGRPLPGGEQVGKVFVSEQLVSVIGQKRVDRALLDKVPAEGGGVEELASGPDFPCIRQFFYVEEEIASILKVA